MRSVAASRTLVAAALLAVAAPAAMVVPVMAAATVAPAPAALSVVAAAAQVSERQRAAFARAEMLFRSGDAELSLAPLSQVIDALLPAAEAGALDDEGRALLVRSLAYRADVYTSAGDGEAADADLERLLTLFPRAKIDGFRLSEALVRRFERARERSLGTLTFSITPLEAHVRVDGVEIDRSTGAWEVPAGSHIVEALLPGYTRGVEEVQVRAGRSLEVAISLSRVSAVVELMTRPAGATVVIDGNVVGQTAGVAPRDWTPRGDAARYPREEFSAPMEVEGLMPGEHDLEVFLDGYRSFDAPLTIPDLGNFRIDAIVLTRNLGTVLLRDLPSEAEVWVDGRRSQPEPPARGGDEIASSAYRLSLAPGQYRITVSEGDAGVFEDTVTVADRGNVALTVRLRPGLTFLGAIGDDALGADTFEEAFAGAFGQLGYWTFLDRSDEADRVLERAGLSAARLRTAADGEEEPGWGRAQEETSRDLPGSVFALAVLAGGDMAAQADVWLWPAAPGPALGERVRVSLTDRAALEALARRLSAEIAFEKAWLGAQLIDSDAAPAPVVASVVEGSPAAAAGLRVGEELIAVAGNSVGTAANAAAWLATFAPGTAVVLGLRGPEGEHSVEVRLGASPVVASPADPDLLYAAVWGMAGAAVGRLDASVPSWIAEANQAAVLVHAREWAAAARLLRGIQAPAGPGVGQGLIDYWLGIALASSGDEEAARAAFERVLAAPEARYLSNDGAYLAPLARARLTALDGGAR